MTAIVLSLFAGLAIVNTALKNRRLAVAIILFALPTYLIRFEVAGIPMTMLEVMIVALFGTYLITDWKKIKQATRTGTSTSTAHGSRFRSMFAFGNTSAVLIIALILIASLFSLIVTPNLEAGLGIFKAYILEPILFFIVFINTVKTNKDLRLVFWALGLSALIVALVAAVQFMTGWGIPAPWTDLPTRRATGFYGFPNAVGLYITPILTLFIGLVIHVKFFTKRNILLVVSLVLFLLLALFTARVEGAFVAVAAGTLVMLLFTKWRWSAVGAAVIGLGIVLAYDTTREILLFQNVSGDVRLALWEGTWNLLQAQPWFGSGLAAFPITYDIYRLPSHVELLEYPHNIFLNFWVELGILGLVWLVGVFVAFFGTALRTFRQTDGYSLVLVGVMVATVVYGLVDVPYFKNDLAILFWTWLGMLFVVIKKSDAGR